MIRNKKMFLYTLPFLVVATSCTKLDENLESRLTSAQAASALGAQGTELLLQTAYTDLRNPFTTRNLVFSLQENTTDEALVPTRGGDWDDNGAWRVLHSHNWDANHQYILNSFNVMNKLNFDATNVLAFNPSTAQDAEARFLRALSLYTLLDLFGQYPFRNPGDNLLNAPEVKRGADAINFIISELTTVLPNIPANNPITRATQDAAKLLLMRCYLNKGAFINRAAPTFDAADMQQVITLGNSIISSNKYSYTPNYFDNFAYNNSALSKEGIFAYPNSTGVSINHGNVEEYWMGTLHYNQYTPVNPNAGWNGFATISDFYNTFGVERATTYSMADSALDRRIGHRFYRGATDVSGLRPGFLVGQQYNENGVALKDRKNNPLAFTPEIAANQIENGNNLEITGIRVVKYVPDYSNGAQNYSSNPGNWIMFFRYPEVVLMVAEAMMRTGDNTGALALVNGLRTARGASTVTAMPLVNTTNVNDPATLLAERGRELYWENVRRTDLIRFGVFLVPWGLKPTDDPKYLLFPIPTQALAANPNLIQNPGYGQ